MKPQSSPPLEPFARHPLYERIRQVRRFERFYAFHLGRLERAAASEDFSASEMRVLLELSMVEGGACNAWLSYRLGIHKSSMSRILKYLGEWGLVTRSASETDGRMCNWDLTPLGRSFAMSAEKDNRTSAFEALEELLPDDRRRLVEAMATIETILTPRALSRMLGVRPRRRARYRRRRPGTP